MKKFDYRDCEIWFVRFSMDRSQTILALGNQVRKKTKSCERTYVSEFNITIRLNYSLATIYYVSQSVQIVEYCSFT